MNKEINYKKELLALVEETSEMLVYFNELGVERIEATLNIETTTAPVEIETPVFTKQETFAQQRPQPQIKKQDADKQRALMRNALAASSLKEISPSSTKDSSLKSARPATDFSIEQKIMATKKEASLFGDSLFGEIAPVNELQQSNETLEDIHRDIGDCKRCGLCEGRTHIVHSEGSPKARLMFVGEAPGADEDAQARPFVGRAGQLLNKIIEAIGLKREEVFIGNINRCRLPANRAPLPDEAAACKPFLMRELAVVRPEIIVVMGNTAMKNLLGTKEGITKLRGIFQDYHGVKVMPTFHPAYLLRDPSKKRETWEDMKKVREYLKNNE